MSYVYLAIFIGVTSVHLYASWKKDQGLRNITKGVILLAILGFYLEAIDAPFSWWIVAALVTSWLGDMFLMGTGIKWFTVGGIFFMISHFCFIMGYNEDVVFSRIPTVAIILFALAFATSVVLTFRKLKEHLPKALFIPMFGYLLLNGAMNCFAIFRAFSLAGTDMALGGLITAIGALGFFISDSTLFFVRFNKDSKIKSHFLVMLTYSIGEFLIILGLV